MDERTLEYLDEVRLRIISVVASSRVGTAVAQQAVAVAQRAFAQVLPRLPAMIESRLPKADAQIMTAQQLADLLAEFAADILAIQTGDLRREVQPRRAGRGGSDG
jgi:hypothetical protein